MNRVFSLEDLNINCLTKDFKLLCKDIKDMKNTNLYWSVPVNCNERDLIKIILTLDIFSKLGFNTLLLFSDVTTFLNDSTLQWDDIKLLSTKSISNFNNVCNYFNINTIQYKLGSEFQLSSEYFFNLYQLSKKTYVYDTIDKFFDNIREKKVKDILINLMNVIDSKYLSSIIQCGTVSQEKLFKILYPKLTNKIFIIVKSFEQKYFTTNINNYLQSSIST